MSTQSSEVPSSALPERNLADYHPSLWGNYFLTFAPEESHMTKPCVTIDTATEEEHEALKEEVRTMISTATTTQKVVLQLIDTIQHLGVAYHFEKEIEDALQKIFHDFADNDIDDGDIYTVSLRFRLLRQQGIMTSCDVFNKFKDAEGKSFKESLKNDVEGMLSLYEAAHLAIHGEEILDEAIAFSTTHLKEMIPHVCPNLAQQINHALFRPLRKALPRLEARYFIDIYARDDSHDQTLLKFAKLDFNSVQAAHHKELSALARWWRDMEFSKLQYARDRLVEAYFWSTGMYFEPRYVFSRIIMTKFIYMITIIDDIFDAYGTFEELKLFTEATKRWNIDVTDIVPEYMKIIYKTMLDINSEVEEELAKEGKSHCIRYPKEKMQELIMLNLVQAKWLKEGYFPTMEEYIDVAWLSIGAPVIIVTSFVGMGDFATEDTFKWLFTNPKMVTAASVISRLLNDLGGHKFEQIRGHSPSAVECYMKQHAVSKEEAARVLKQQIADAWKDVNEEFLINPTAVPFPLLERILNLLRAVHFMYRDGDGDCFTHPSLMKDQVASLLIDPVVL